MLLPSDARHFILSLELFNQARRQLLAASDHLASAGCEALRDEALEVRRSIADLYGRTQDTAERVSRDGPAAKGRSP